MSDNPVQEAIDRIGGQAALARKLGLKQPAICKWVKKGIVPAYQVLMVEKLTGVPRSRLNPRIYPNENGDNKS